MGSSNEACKTQMAALGIQKGLLHTFVWDTLLQDRIFSNSQNPRRLQNAAKALLECHNYPEPQRTIRQR